MALVDVSVSVEKSGVDIMQGLAKFIAACKAAHKAGSNLAVEIPSDVAAAIADLAPLIADIQALPSDWSEDKLKFLKGVNLGSWDVVEAIVS